jgi:two-component system chemotaxis sensor kinase CheA
VQILDRLMTLAGELVLVRNQALRAAEVFEPQQLRQVVQRLNAITTDVQQAVLLTRMQPVSNLFGKFPRLVRDLSKRLNKQIELTVLGAEVELDKSILESLSDPLTHLVRNSCDHGIELPAERTAAGKTPEGHLLLQAHHEGGQIRIEIRDDGRGIDPALIRRKALAKGLKTASELEAMSDTDVQSLILLPGFSMAEQVTELSGRGVGMDVVKTNLERLGGSLQIESRPGHGTCMHLRLPLTLAIIPCLLVRSGSERYAVPQRDLEELVCIPSDQVGAKVERSFDQEVYRLRDRLLPLVRLSEVLRRPVPFTSETRAEIVRTPREPGHLFFAVVKVGMQRLGLVVDELLNTEEIVVKPMHSALKLLRCFSGGTIMGDGRVSLILDVEGIARHAGIAHEAARWLSAAGVVGQDEKQTILLFRYGPQEQFAVPLALVRRIEEIRVSRIEHAGEREYITIKGQTLPIVRLDRYLPVSPAQEEETMYLLLPKPFKRPVGILLSRIIDTECRSIQLDTTSYREDGVIGTAVLHERMTIFLDLYRLSDRLTAKERTLEPVRPTGQPGRPRILLVEDTQFFRTLVRGYLESQGYEVTTAENGLQALTELSRATFDLVVSDIEMPEMDGWRLASALREKLGLKNLPLLALTTLSSERDRQRARECGFDAYEVKLDRESFQASVSRLLKKSSVPQEGAPAHG